MTRCPGRTLLLALLTMLTLLLPAAALVGEVGREGLLMLFPQPSDLGGWRPEGPPQQAVGEELFSLIDGGAEVFLRAGFVWAAIQTYTMPERPSIDLEIYEMTGPEAAQAVFAKKTEGDGQPIRLGAQAVQGGYYLIFRHGRFLVTVTGADATPDTQAALMDFSRAVEARIKQHR